MGGEGAKGAGPEGGGGRSHLTTMQPPEGMLPTGTSMEARASTSAEAFM